MALLPRPGLGVYVTAGWPNGTVFVEFLDVAAGITDFVKVGMPAEKYDGPFIRSSHGSAPVKGIAALRGLELPENAILMGRAEDFAGRCNKLTRAAAGAGAASILLPNQLIDMPKMLNAYAASMRANGLASTFFLPGKSRGRLGRPPWLERSP